MFSWKKINKIDQIKTGRKIKLINNINNYNKDFLDKLGKDRITRIIGKSNNNHYDDAFDIYVKFNKEVYWKIYFNSLSSDWIIEYDSKDKLKINWEG